MRNQCINEANHKFLLEWRAAVAANPELQYLVRKRGNMRRYCRRHHQPIRYDTPVPGVPQDPFFATRSNPMSPQRRYSRQMIERWEVWQGRTLVCSAAMGLDKQAALNKVANERRQGFTMEARPAKPLDISPRLGDTAKRKEQYRMTKRGMIKNPKQPRAKKERRPKAAKPKAQRKPKAERQAKVPKEPRQPKADSKKALVLGMISKPGGATLAQVMEATGWLEKTVRSFMVTVPPKLGLDLRSEKIDGVRTYSVKQAA